MIRGAIGAFYDTFQNRIVNRAEHWHVFIAGKELTAGIQLIHGDFQHLILGDRIQPPKKEVREHRNISLFLFAL